MEYSYYVEPSAVSAPLMFFMWLVCLAISIVSIAALWVLFKKAGKGGWEAIIPYYNCYTLFDVVYGKGIKFLLLLIPIFNFFVMIKLYIDLAKAFGKSTGYGIGLLLLPIIFMPLLAFSSDTVYCGPVGKEWV